MRGGLTARLPRAETVKIEREYVRFSSKFLRFFQAERTAHSKIWTNIIIRHSITVNDDWKSFAVDARIVHAKIATRVTRNRATFGRTRHRFAPKMCANSRKPNTKEIIRRKSNSKSGIAIKSDEIRKTQRNKDPMPDSVFILVFRKLKQTLRKTENQYFHEVMVA